MLRVGLSAAVVLCTMGMTWADVESGPAVGEKPPALTVQVVAAGQAAEPVDIVKERADHPTVYILLPADKFDRPAARYVKGIDAAVGKLQKIKPNAGMVVVWLTADAAAGTQRVTQIQGSMQLTASQWAVGTSISPEGWGLHERAAVTAVLSVKGKVTARFGYDSINETDIAKLADLLKPLESP